jgi:hypothetical protein
MLLTLGVAVVCAIVVECHRDQTEFSKIRQLVRQRNGITTCATYSEISLFGFVIMKGTKISDMIFSDSSELSEADCEELDSYSNVERVCFVNTKVPTTRIDHCSNLKRAGIRYVFSLLDETRFYCEGQREVGDLFYQFEVSLNLEIVGHYTHDTVIEIEDANISGIELLDLIKSKAGLDYSLTIKGIELSSRK